MKKKKITLSKKLLLKKDAVVELNVLQQAGIGGGMPKTWKTTCCSQDTLCELC
ncbi:hypothetical protein HHL17_25755 [Chitinophaga sp. G-6-1-13]|uniref:Uncharacterized protein n=1 Tax=Chitinophaga fulva TaxID=2728842 RepID=A0A848GYB4_9BACT|nr:class I lanthipeptide [Chitinophaga fulva]NML40628.1 hypothetical protein [Chitinophaga fulva]